MHASIPSQKINLHREIKIPTLRGIKKNKSKVNYILFNSRLKI